jgi:hypothetical protein
VLGAYFKYFKHIGLSQGDPTSPILFNPTVEAMSVIIKNAQMNGFITGLVPHLQENDIVIL